MELLVTAAELCRCRRLHSHVISRFVVFCWLTVICSCLRRSGCSRCSDGDSRQRQRWWWWWWWRWWWVLAVFAHPGLKCPPPPQPRTSFRPSRTSSLRTDCLRATMIASALLPTFRRRSEIRFTKESREKAQWKTHRRHRRLLEMRKRSI